MQDEVVPENQVSEGLGFSFLHAVQDEVVPRNRNLEGRETRPIEVLQ